MTKKTKKALEARGSLNYGNCDARYEVPLPIRGDLDLRYDWIPEAVGYFGAPPDVQVHVYPLEGQTLDTHAEISTAPSVRAGGSAVVTQADVVAGKPAASGKYVLTARVSGSMPELGLSLVLRPGRGVTTRLPRLRFPSAPVRARMADAHRAGGRA